MMVGSVIIKKVIAVLCDNQSQCSQLIVNKYNQGGDSDEEVFSISLDVDDSDAVGGPAGSGGRGRGNAFGY